MWSWWLEKQNQIKNGEIPANTPGYAMVKWNNEAEQRWLKTLNVEAMNEE
ncbi:hypothetical protein Pmar_PMAR024999 [Perkinsus marinus ATCC 50983]|nr:hypothetical protein Pmar_PMAR024999 [Perkinsus marinus ATCC 50983]EER06497.1 hypothetical protein Pmar_PMAR024999 [Perkinsus marinus ATCC 50983]|eukprot:XP_002774681.1 hypothetical protein Pmar_PMAR024999 [Perkinsus marinus ATCC 50983]